jgi:release factor glutamine methyltransferase
MRYSELFYKSLELFDTPSKALEVQMLMEHVFGFSRTDFWVRKNDRVSDKSALRRFYRYRQRRLKREPMAYILKQREFYGEMFYVDRNVLIPRWETELLVEKAMEKINSVSSKSQGSGPVEVLDIGAGSGAIAVTLAVRTGCMVTAVDICGDALKVLQKNILRFGVQDYVQPVLADLFPDEARGFDVIVSNPPYVAEDEWRRLEPGVREFEPKKALVAEKHGLAVIEQIIRRGRGFLKRGGWLLLEMGYNQESDVRRLMEGAGFVNKQFFKDLNDIGRVAAGRRGD